MNRSLFVSSRGAVLAVVALLAIACSARGGTGFAPVVDAGAAGDGLSTSTADVPPLNLYQGCQRDEECQRGASCIPASLTVGTGATRFCSLPCSSNVDCPLAPFGGSLPLCVAAADHPSLCYNRCDDLSPCGVGTVCRTLPPSTTTRFCVPTAGETGPNTRAPYARCTEGDPCDGARCLVAGVSVAGAAPGMFCTSVCAGDASTCPGYAPGGTPSVVCLRVPSAPTSQCHRLCNGPADCEGDGTVCIELATLDGARVRVCAPQG